MSFRVRRTWLALSICAVLGACQCNESKPKMDESPAGKADGGDEPKEMPPKAGTSGTMTGDAGVTKDAGADKDASTTMDAGATKDAATKDAATDDDAAVAEDANVDEPDANEDAAIDDEDAGDATTPNDSGEEEPDETPPVLSVSSTDNVVLDCGDSFEPLELTAQDETDGELEVTVDGADAVDTTEPASFEVTYTAVDQAGNRSELVQTVIVCGPACGELGQEAIDLSPWSIEQYEQDTQPDANWVLSDDNLSVEQTVNADASMLLSDFDATDLSVEGSWRMTGSSDNDFVGFVFGYQDRGHYYLFDWKRGTQTYNGVNAEVGMSLKIVEAAGDPATLQLQYEDLWANEGTANVRPVLIDGIPVHNTTPWDFNHSYRFFLEFHAGSFRIDVYDESATLLESWSVEDDTYTSGKFGFYNFSQGPVVYEGFVSRVTPPDCSTVEGEL